MTAPQLFDRALLRRRLDRAAPGYPSARFLKARAAADAVERLEAIMRDFPLAVDLGARNGVFARLLAESPARERIGTLIETDLSARMLAGRSGLRLIADPERLPLARESVNLIVSILDLHTTNDLPGALIQIRQALKPDGLFLGAIIGGASLNELRVCLMEAEVEVRGGAGARVAPFADVRDAGALLQRAGFALPVADTDRVTVAYSHPLKLMHDLRAMGESGVLTERAGPLSRQALARTCELYAQRHARADGKVTATFDLISLTGWAPHESQQQPLKPGSAKMRLADALNPPRKPWA